MKSRITRTLAVAMVAVFLFSACYGKFRLTDKVYTWNGSLGDKFIVSLVGFGLVVLPVYEICLFVDAVILNSIEFWTGTNPMALNDGEVIHQTVTKNNETIHFTTMKNRVDFMREATGEEGTLFYNETEKSWYIKTRDVSYKAASVQDGQLELLGANGVSTWVSLPKL